MSTDPDFPDSASAPVPRVTHEYKFSHVTTGRYLPTPGKAPGWPFAEIGHWKMDVDGSADDWVAELTDWRARAPHPHRLRRRQLPPPRAAVGAAQLRARADDGGGPLLLRPRHRPLHRRPLPRRSRGALRRHRQRADLVRLSQHRHRRPQPDRPGPRPARRPRRPEAARWTISTAAACACSCPPCRGTTAPATPEQTDWQAIAELVKAVGADGINGDTYNGVPRAFFDACDALGCPVVLQPESTDQRRGAADLERAELGQEGAERGDPAGGQVEVAGAAPHDQLSRTAGAATATNDLQYIFFNGIGYNAWENVWGIWNQLTPRDAETLRRIAAIERQFAPAAGQPGLAAVRAHACRPACSPAVSRPTACTLWTLVNRNEYAVAGEQIALPHRDGTRYYDVWNGVRAAAALDDGRAVLRLRAGRPRLRRAAGAGAPARRSTASTPSSRACANAAAVPLAVAVEPVAFAAAAAGADRAHRAALPKRAATAWSRFPPATFDFVVGGVEIEGQTWDGIDVQYPWEEQRPPRPSPPHADATPSTSTAPR